MESDKPSDKKFIVIGVDIDEWPIDEVPYIPWSAMTHVPEWKKQELVARYHRWEQGENKP